MARLRCWRAVGEGGKGAGKIGNSLAFVIVENEEKEKGGGGAGGDKKEKKITSHVVISFLSQDG